MYIYIHTHRHMHIKNNRHYWQPLNSKKTKPKILLLLCYFWKREYLHTVIYQFFYQRFCFAIAFINILNYKFTDWITIYGVLSNVKKKKKSKSSHVNCSPFVNQQRARVVITTAITFSITSLKTKQYMLGCQTVNCQTLSLLHEESKVDPVLQCSIFNSIK